MARPLRPPLHYTPANKDETGGASLHTTGDEFGFGNLAAHLPEPGQDPSLGDDDDWLVMVPPADGMISQGGRGTAQHPTKVVVDCVSCLSVPSNEEPLNTIIFQRAV